VDQTSVDAFVRARGLKVDFIKLDVEGYEFEVLKGSIQTLERDKPVIVMEFKSVRLHALGIDPNEIARFLMQWYDVYFIVSRADSSVLPSLEPYNADFKGKSANLFCVPRDRWDASLREMIKP
jgi:hypothetical protein